MKVKTNKSPKKNVRKAVLGEIKANIFPESTFKTEDRFWKHKQNKGESTPRYSSDIAKHQRQRDLKR